ncbi:hypothetical protein HUE87_05665 [Candidatus Sulfurimonas marisnigri]|uniref:Uncharacterized protein n=1 Tax=Candidatus Sulfurimonas marisnigri TaxID=2740405 RepID=A0A7S7M232_9BACT|nr:hypothetical protein [Candidatus Sulfurimonas marisnigri]QOY55712.1 hypothetical protein HUE87_05665 [Candidatus Sulfurimonas marisnigri]
MLTKIVLLNCAKYEQGIITINDVESIQIVGRNNLGKTTLISVLNFLYLPSQKDWNFDHTPKETLNFYFKKLDKNYILFEIYKDGYFCILMKRGLNNDLEYYKIDSSYDEIKDKIIQNSKLLKFESIQENLLGNISKLDNKKYKTLLYGHSKRDKTVLWLKENKQNVFSRVYRYLLDITQIDNYAVKESLLVSDNREKIKREFTNIDNDNIQSMQKQQRVIERLKNIKEEFTYFKNIVSEFIVKSSVLVQSYSDFLSLYQAEKKELEDIVLSSSRIIEHIEKEKILPLKNNIEKIGIEKGTIESDLKHQSISLDKELKTKEKILKYDDIGLLRIAQENLNSEMDKKKYDLEQIKQENYTLEMIDGLINSTKIKQVKLSKQIENYENLLIHHISEDVDAKRIISSVLSKDVLELDKRNIIEIVRSISDGSLKLFDGEIDISSIKAVDFITIESLMQELKQVELSIEKYAKVKNNIENYNGIKAEIQRLEKEISLIVNQIKEISTLPDILNKITSLEEDGKSLTLRLSEITSKADENKQNLEAAELLVQNEQDKEQISKERLAVLNAYHMNFKDELEELENINIENSSDKTIDELAEEIKTLRKELNKLNDAKNSTFRDLKHILQKEHAIENDFIKEVEEEIDTIKDKENTVSELIQNITNEISAPTKTFLRELEDFEKYIVSANTAFKKYKVSNIQTIEIKLVKNENIIYDLKQIADIKKDDLFDFDENKTSSYEEQINILKGYISKSKVFTLSDLFDVAFVINGKVANLNKQIESTGTDKILKIMLFILIIKNIIIQDEDNKLVVYVDELSAVDDDNSAELIRICKENNLIPIFASPDKKINIQKYYDLQELSNGQIVVDENRAILWEK